VSIDRHLDQFFTPRDLAQRLCDEFLAHRKWARVLEPSSGGGSFCQAIRPHAGHLMGNDLEPKAGATRECHRHRKGDFLEMPTKDKFDLIVGNPPFTEAEKHVRHGLAMLTHGGRLAFLLRLAFAESKARIPFWREHRASSIVVMAERPSFTGGATDSCAYAFFIWDKPHAKTTQVIPGWSWKGVEQASLFGGAA
jgi:hypothetical protein